MSENSSIGLEEARRVLEAASEGGRITCEAARTAAEKAGISYREAGRILDDLHIKITACGLGCF